VRSKVEGKDAWQWLTANANSGSLSQAGRLTAFERRTFFGAEIFAGDAIWAVALDSSSLLALPDAD